MPKKSKSKKSPATTTTSSSAPATTTNSASAEPDNHPQPHKKETEIPTPLSESEPSTAASHREQPTSDARAASPPVSAEEGGSFTSVSAVSLKEQESSAPAAAKQAPADTEGAATGFHVVAPLEPPAPPLEGHDADELEEETEYDPAANLPLDLEALDPPWLASSKSSRLRNAQASTSREMADVFASSVDEDDEYDIKQIDHYEVLEMLGQGSQGTVYRCRDSNDPTIIRAMKEIRGLAGKTNELRNEIAVMQQLNHRNVTRLYEVYDAPDLSSSVYLVMDFVDGGPIMRDEDVLAGVAKPLLPADAQRVFHQLLNGLAYLHARGVLHRDIKPSNVLRDRTTGVVKLADFGVSSFTSPHKSARMLGEDDIVYVGSCGTPALLSPEALGAGNDRVYHGRAADVWAAGVTLYIMLYGILPFRDPHGTSLDETTRCIVEENLRFPPSLRILGPTVVPRAARDVMTRMLVKDSSKRATLATIMSTPWYLSVKDDPSAMPTAQDHASPAMSAVTQAVIFVPNVFDKVRRTAGAMVHRTLSEGKRLVTKNTLFNGNDVAAAAEAYAMVKRQRSEANRAKSNRRGSVDKTEPSQSQLHLSDWTEDVAQWFRDVFCSGQSRCPPPPGQASEEAER